MSEGGDAVRAGSEDDGGNEGGVCEGGGGSEGRGHDDFTQKGAMDPGKRGAAARPKGDFIDLFDFYIFLRILGQSSKCEMKKYANLIRKMHPPKLGFLSDPLPSGPGGGHSTPVPTRVGHSMPVASTPRAEAGAPVLAQG